jgi:hypothetical protein
MIDIFRRLAAEVAASPSSVNSGFHFPDRIVVFPEMRCPFCNQVVRCKRIWRINNGRVPFYWDVVRGRRRGWKLIRGVFHAHPHVSSSTDVCMGDAETEEQALFTGMNPYDSFWENYEIFGWLETVWDHRCPEKVQVLREDE